MLEQTDRTLVCRECGAEFPFTVREQAEFQERGFEHEPTRCPECRAARRPQRREKEWTEIVCAGCGVITGVPFRPVNRKPLYCRDCFGVLSPRVEG